MPTIRLENVAKIYKSKTRENAAIKNVNLTIEQGEFVFVVGSRGAGKSTLLDVIAGVLKPEQGQVFLDDADLYKLSPRESEKKRACIGRIAQESELNRMETVYDNLSTMKRVGLFRKKVVDESLADKALGIVGMPGTGKTFPRDLTPPECRRIQVAKAILNSPAILMLDDFTMNMDEDTIWDMLHLLMELNRRGTTILMATNSSYVVNVMRRRVVTLADGRVVGDVKKGKYGFIG